MTHPYLSVVIPLYNEEQRVSNLSKICSYLNSKSFTFEVLVVNDGSSDNTLKKLKKMFKKQRFDLISYTKNRGKGFAIKQGILKARGKFSLFTDIDLSTPIEELDKFYHHLKRHDLVIGSRKIQGSNLVKRQPFIRETMGKGFTKLSKSILGLNISDFTCGFKVFNKNAAKEIFTHQKLDTWGFDSEILFIASKLGFSIKEIPVVWVNDPKSRVRFPQDIIKSLAD